MINHRFSLPIQVAGEGWEVKQHVYAIKKHLSRFHLGSISPAIRFLTEFRKYPYTESHKVLHCEALFKGAIQS